MRNKKIELQTPIYSRQKGESDAAWNAFLAYRDTPIDVPRSLRDIAEKSDLSSQTIRTYAQRFSWRERVMAYDKHLDAARIEVIQRGVAEMRERHVNISRMMLDLVQRKLATIQPQNLTARDAKDWLLAAARVELLARDLPTSIVSSIRSDDSDTTRRMRIESARSFYHEFRQSSPDFPVTDLLEIIEKEFHVKPGELGVKSDVLDAGVIDDVIDVEGNN